MGEDTDYEPDKYAFYRSGAAVCIGTVELLYVRARQGLGILGVLLLSEGDCERPMRTWLWTLMGLYFAHVGFFIFAECTCNSYVLRNIVKQCYLPVNSFAEGAIFLWVLLGNVWFFDCMSTCRDDFEEGFMLTLVVLSTYYCVVFIVSVVVLLLAVLICFGNSVANRAKYSSLS